MNNLFELILFIIIGVGITNLIVNASMLDKFRSYIANKSGFLKQLLSCMMCSGFWVGIILTIFQPDLDLLSGGIIISFFSYIVGIVLDYLHILTAVASLNFEDQDLEDEE